MNEGIDIGDRIIVAQLIRCAQGGMKEHYISLIKGLLDAGIGIVALCSLSSKDRNTLKGLGARVIPFTIKGRFRLLKDAIAILRLVRILSRNKVHILHCHGFRAGFIGRIAAVFVRCPCIYTMHNFLPLGLGRTGRLLSRWGERLLSKIPGLIITVSKPLKSQAVNALGIKGNKIKVIYNGIHIPKTMDKDRHKELNDLKNLWGIEKGEKVIGTVARLIPSKGIDTLIDAIPKVIEHEPRLKFMIVGDGPYRDKLKDRVRRLNCSDHIIFTGYREDIWLYYELFDIFVLPSLSEGLGISILEAMAMGKPVIATRVGGIPEIVEDGENGYLVEPGNKDNLSSAILHLLTHPEIAMKFGQRGKQTSKEKFSTNTMISKTLRVIDETIEANELPKSLY